MHTSSPLLLVQQREQRASRDILGYDGKLAGVIQTCSHKLDDTGVIEAAKDGDLPAEHVHVWLGAVCVGSVATNNMRHGKTHQFSSCLKWDAKCQIQRRSTVLWQRFCFGICLCRLFQRSLSVKQIQYSVRLSNYMKHIHWPENIWTRLPDPIISLNSSSDSWRWKWDGRLALSRRTSAFSVNREQHFYPINKQLRGSLKHHYPIKKVTPF